MCIQINTEKCTACLKCVHVCPTQSLDKTTTHAKDHVKVNPDTCIDCYACVDQCPTHAIKEP